jgi:hypothetical protein
MKNGASPKRSNSRTGEPPPEVQGATCLAIPVEAVDASMWPVHAAGWLEPEARAAAPSWTGLIVERRNRVPAPDLIQFPLAPFPRDGAIDAARGAISAAAAPTLRQSDLAPLGWDPRAAFPKKESQ